VYSSLNLEQDLGVVLFERNNRNVRLTPAGVYLRDEMIKLDKRFKDTLSHAISIQKGHVGTIRIGYPGSALYSILPEVLCLLQHKMPLLDGVLTEMAEVKVLETLVNGHIDVCFSREEVYDHPNVCQRKLFSEPMALVVPDQHAITRENFKSIAQCREEGFILPYLADWQRYRQLIYGIFSREDFVPRIAYESNFGATIMRLVEKNLGISILPLSYRMGSSLKVRFIPLKIQTTLYLVWRTDDHSPIVQNFIALCDEAAGKLDLNFECP
jgi:DNA-binding transcriptional LysR family regulator